MKTKLTHDDLLELLQKGLLLKLYNRYSKELWLIPVLCPDFLKKCSVEIISMGVRLEFEYITDRYLAKVIDPEKIHESEEGLEHKGKWLAYLELLLAVDPSLDMGFTYPPKPLWDILYSLASLVFALEVGRDKPFLVSPITRYEKEIG